MPGIAMNLCNCLEQFRRSQFWRPVGTTLRLTAGLALLVLSLFQVDLKEVGLTLIQARPSWALLASVSVLGSIGLKAARWVWLLRRIGAPVSWRRAVGAYLIGQAANIVLPVRGGDVLRAGWVGTLAPAAAAILLEKYADLVVLAFLTGILGVEWLVPGSTQNLPWITSLGSGILLAAWAAPALWMRFRPSILAWLSHRFSRWVSKIDLLAEHISQAATFKGFTIFAGLTVLIWANMLLTNLLVLGSLNMPFDLRAGARVLALVYIGVVPALMPGNLGPFTFFAILGLSGMTVNEQQRAAFAALLYALVNLPPLLLSAIYLLAQERVTDKNRYG